MSDLEDYQYIKVGIMPLDEIQQRTIDIASGEYKPKPDEPKLWFSSVYAFKKALGCQMNINERDLVVSPEFEADH